MTVQIAHLYATACLAIVFFQIALIAGAPLGAYTQGGRYGGALPLSGRIAAAVAIPVLLFQALAILSAAGFPGLGWPVWTGWVAFGVQAASTVLDRVTRAKAERAVWGPVSLVMTTMALVVLAA